MRRFFALLGLLFAVTFSLTPTYAAPLAVPVGAPALVAHHYTATAAVSRPAPTINQTETISARLLDGGKPVAGAQMITKWYYKTTTSSCTSVTGASGRASCARSISHATPGYPVRVSVTFVKA